jgi:hypothetical protein
MHSGINGALFAGLWNAKKGENDALPEDSREVSPDYLDTEG